jgi:two-component system response regulator YesN
LVLEENQAGAKQAAGRWFDRVRKERYDPGVVKDWTLKMMIDLQLKLKSLQYFQTNYAQEVVHKRVAGIETLSELEQWFVAFLNESIAAVGEIHRGPQKREVMEAVKYIEKNLSQRISLEEVSDYLHLSPSYFSRLFKKETGEGFVEFVTRQKVGKAKELLVQTDKTVDEISYSLGYENKSYFLKIFKQYTGATPSEYAGRFGRL